MSFTPFASNLLIHSRADLLPYYTSRNTLPSAAVRNIKNQNETHIRNLCYLGSHFPCFAPIQHYQFNIITKYVHLSLQWYIFIHLQWVQFYEDPICLLDPCFNILDCSSVNRYDNTRCSTLSITTGVILAQYKSILNSPDNAEIGFQS